MTWSRTAVLKTWGVVAVLILLFPHFVLKVNGSTVDAGWGFLFKGARERLATVDVPLLFTMQAIAAGLAFMAYRMGWATPPQLSEEEKSAVTLARSSHHVSI